MSQCAGNPEGRAAFAVWSMSSHPLEVTLKVSGAPAGKQARSCSITRRVLSALGSLLLFAFAASVARSAPPQGKSESVPAGNAEAGKRVFTKDGCYECHGREGQGAAQASGPRIGPSQRFIRPFINYVRQPTGQMPPYTSEVISDQELADIYAYLQSRPRPTPSKDIPLLNQ